MREREKRAMPPSEAGLARAAEPCHRAPESSRATCGTVTAHNSTATAEYIKKKTLISLFLLGNCLQQIRMGEYVKILYLMVLIPGFKLQYF